MRAGASEPAKVVPYCVACGREIASLTGACPVSVGASNYLCRRCGPTREETTADSGHYIGLTDDERLMRTAARLNAP
jgi:DNA-directed RNA polymerase subunit RPC12/RpoP